MKIVLNKKALSINPDRFLRKVGYGFITDRKTGNSSYVRRLGGGHYPRLHMYFDEVGDRISFNLHLDQKQASYSGSHMHNAEYEGGVVENEINRLKDLLKLEKLNSKDVIKETDVNEKEKDLLKEMGQGQIDKKLEKKPWWKNIF